MTSQTRTFDFEITLDDCSPEELAYCLDRLKAAGQPVQLVAAKIADIAKVGPLAQAARTLGAALSFLASGGESVEAINQIGRAAMGRLNYHVALSSGAEVVSIAASLRG